MLNYVQATALLYSALCLPKLPRRNIELGICRDVAATIIKSDDWQAALKIEKTDEGAGMRSTPLRKMVEKMPGQ